MITAIVQLSFPAVGTLEEDLASLQNFVRSMTFRFSYRTHSLHQLSKLSNRPTTGSRPSLDGPGPVSHVTSGPFHVRRSAESSFSPGIIMRRRALPFLVVVAACYEVPIAPATPSAWQVTGDGQTGVPGYRLPNQIVVRIADADGRPIVGDTIDFTPSDPLAFVEPRSVVITDSTGSASVSWRLGPTLGSQTLSAHSRVPGVSAVVITAASKSNHVQSIAEVGDNGMCAVDMQGLFGCWAPPRPFIPDSHSRFIPLSAPVHFTQVAMLSTAPQVFNAFTTNSSGCVLADTGRPWCFTLDSLANVQGLAELPGAYPPLTQLVSGGWNSASYCGLTALGEAWCWGANNFGQLGDGTNIGHPTPAAVTTSARFVQLDMSSTDVCGLTAAGEAWCWGDNISLEAGAPAGTNTATPVAINTALRFASIRSIGSLGVSCGFALGGGMYCWGDVSIYLTTNVSQLTAAPVAIPLNPHGVDVFEGGGFDMVFDQRAGIDWGGDPNQALPCDCGGVSFPQRFPLTGLLSDIRLAHGYRYSCGTAALGGATLCVSVNGLFYLTLESHQFGSPAVVGVPFP